MVGCAFSVGVCMVYGVYQASIRGSAQASGEVIKYWGVALKQWQERSSN